MPVERTSGGGTTITGAAIDGYRAAVLMSGMRMYLESNGRITPSRHVTPAVMRTIASQYTGRTYPRSRKGMERALADLERLAEGKSLDEVGEVLAVNAEVGGVAADLAE